jgi:thiamine transport system substrate-binding protein
MYPAVTPAAGLPQAFAELPTPPKSLMTDAAAAAALREKAIAAWREGLSR